MPAAMNTVYATSDVDNAMLMFLPLQYKPRAGDALLFWSIHPNGTFDKHALHGGCPVMKGEKWVATKWIRDKCFRCNN